MTFLEPKKEIQGQQIPQYTETAYTQPMSSVTDAHDPMGSIGMNEPVSFNIMEDDIQF